MKTALYRIWSPFLQCVASMALNHLHPRRRIRSGWAAHAVRWPFQAICPSLAEATHPGPGYPLAARAPCTTDATGTPQRALRLSRAQQRARFTGLGFAVASGQVKPTENQSEVPQLAEHPAVNR